MVLGNGNGVYTIVFGAFRCTPSTFSALSIHTSCRTIRWNYLQQFNNLIKRPVRASSNFEHSVWRPLTHAHATTPRTILFISRAAGV
jgi:hypothetical protein